MPMRVRLIRWDKNAIYAYAEEIWCTAGIFHMQFLRQRFFSTLLLSMPHDNNNNKKKSEIKSSQREEAT